MERSERKFQEFVEFLLDFIHELNDLSRDGAVVLVEGKRDAEALVSLGFSGRIVTSSSIRVATSTMRKASQVIILTDLDSEGRRMAARYIRLLSAMGIETTLVARRRLSRGSRGRFLHVENLVRFAPLLSTVHAPPTEYTAT